ncbi:MULTISPECIES: TRAP transporter small permease subunit [unclassified Pseudomonas]|uniref:TRAP transporter small permease subunit n=1 Tax=unclassified Pseudomonas TaxID=196821 RepID=UPI00131D63C0|nr:MULTISPECIES: TRAP transporter small permease [unclassified Pseudomonas]
MNTHSMSFIERCSRVLGVAAGGGMALLFLLMIAEVCYRNVTGRSLGFTWEFSGYLFGAIIFLGSAWTLRCGAQVRIRFMLDMLPPRWARLLDTFACLCGFLIALYLFCALCGFTWQAWSRDIVSSTPEQVPLVWPRALLTLGSGMFCLQLLAQALAVLLGRETSSTPTAASVHAS